MSAPANVAPAIAGPRTAESVMSSISELVAALLDQAGLIEDDALGDLLSIEEELYALVDQVEDEEP